MSQQIIVKLNDEQLRYIRSEFTEALDRATKERDTYRLVLEDIADWCKVQPQSAVYLMARRALDEGQP